MITDESVSDLYNQSVAAMPAVNLDPNYKVINFYRGVTSKRWKNNPHKFGCRFNITVFHELNIIPEYCFSCFKVFIAPSSVLELFKLMMVFHAMKLPENNSRKCMVERRPKISGTYKGYLYCQSYSEAKDLFVTTRDIVSSEISPEIPISIKRGCSEYPLLYPEYGDLGERESKLMAYKEEWREKEKLAEARFGNRFKPIIRNTYDHPGFDQNDVLAMRSWLAYANAIGDLSYLSIAPMSIIQPMPNVQDRSLKTSL